MARLAIQAAHECGQMLIKVRDSLEHGEWLYWLKAHCPDVSKATAYRYVGLASKVSHVGNLEDCAGLRQAYISAGILPEPEAGTGKAASSGNTWLSPFTKLDSILTEETLLKFDELALEQVESRLRLCLKRVEEAKAKREALAV